MVFLDLEEVWAIEAADRLTYVHSARGRYDLDLSLAAMQLAFARDLVRVHRNWVVNLAAVRELQSREGESQLSVGPGVAGKNHGLHVPVARERAADVRAILLADSVGLRRKADGAAHPAVREGGDLR
jgi:DNA-binding LytR/AlgR family response regulator